MSSDVVTRRAVADLPPVEEDGTEVADGKGETVLFGLDGQEYEIDLSDKNAKAFRTAMKQYVEHGREVSKRPGRNRNPEATMIREWIRYSTPGPEGAEYVAICLTAFSPATVHRDA